MGWPKYQEDNSEITEERLAQKEDTSSDLDTTGRDASHRDTLQSASIIDDTPKASKKPAPSPKRVSVTGDFSGQYLLVLYDKLPTRRQVVGTEFAHIVLPGATSIIPVLVSEKRKMIYIWKKIYCKNHIEILDVLQIKKHSGTGGIGRVGRTGTLQRGEKSAKSGG